MYYGSNKVYTASTEGDGDEKLRRRGAVAQKKEEKKREEKKKKCFGVPVLEHDPDREVVLPLRVVGGSVVEKLEREVRSKAAIDVNSATRRGWNMSSARNSYVHVPRAWSFSGEESRNPVQNEISSDTPRHRGLRYTSSASWRTEQITMQAKMLHS